MLINFPNSIKILPGTFDTNRCNNCANSTTRVRVIYHKMNEVIKWYVVWIRVYLLEQDVPVQIVSCHQKRLIFQLSQKSNCHLRHTHINTLAHSYTFAANKEKHFVYLVCKRVCVCDNKQIIISLYQTTANNDFWISCILAQLSPLKKPSN